MARDPDASIPKQNKVWKASKGAYRLFDHQRSTYQSMLQPHWQATLSETNQCAGVILMIQDTSELDYTSHPKTSGLGRFGSGPIGKSGLGMLLHNVLAVVPPAMPAEQPRVLGLAWGKLWSRGPDLSSQERRARNNKWKKDWPRESQRWMEAVREIGAAPAGRMFVHVGDREADIFDLMSNALPNAVVDSWSVWCSLATRNWDT